MRLGPRPSARRFIIRTNPGSNRMDISAPAFESLLRAIHDVEYSMPGPEFNIEAAYVGDSKRYVSFPPTRDNPFTPVGLRDPALGNTGPLRFDEIDLLVVHAVPRCSAVSSEYAAKRAALVRRASAIPGILIDDNEMSLSRDAVQRFLLDEHASQKGPITTPLD